MAAPLGFKTFTTGEVLTAADTNGYLMQGVLVFADAAARSAAITSPQEGQTSYLKDTDEIQVYSGSAWVTKSGGLPSQTGNSGKYLTTDGTNASWGTVSAGGMTLLSTTTLSGSSTTISSINQSYKDLLIIVRSVDINNTNDNFKMSFNGGSNQFYGRAAINTQNTQANPLFSNTDFRLDFQNATKANAANNSWAMNLYQYTNTSAYKVLDGSGYFEFNDGAVGVTAGTFGGAIQTNSAITSITFFTGSTFAAGTVLLYGVS